MLIAADDRTGALETAGAIAERIGRAVQVIVRYDGDRVAPSDRSLVVDLGSRHLSPADAAARSAQCVTAGPAGHKIDSMLRGNWAAEVLARSNRVLVVPALPAAGRVCRGGVVYDGEVPLASGVAGRDARQAVDSSRPADHLRSAGAIEVAELGDLGALERWLAGSGRCAVMDASSDADLDAIAQRWAQRPHVLLAGTSAVLGAGAAAYGEGPRRGASLSVSPHLPSPVLVVCGSMHEGARVEIATLADRGVTVVAAGPGSDVPSDVRDALAVGEPAVLTTPLPTRLPLAAHDADAMAVALANVVDTVVDAVEVGTLIVIGGDSAATILGDRDRWVSGLLAPGTPWCAPSHEQPMIVTRAGGLGTAMSLEQLVLGRMGP